MAWLTDLAVGYDGWSSLTPSSLAHACRRALRLRGIVHPSGPSLSSHLMHSFPLATVVSPDWAVNGDCHRVILASLE